MESLLADDSYLYDTPGRWLRRTHPAVADAWEYHSESAAQFGSPDMSTAWDEGPEQATFLWRQTQVDRLGLPQEYAALDTSPEQRARWNDLGLAFPVGHAVQTVTDLTRTAVGPDVGVDYANEITAMAPIPPGHGEPTGEHPGEYVFMGVPYDAATTVIDDGDIVPRLGVGRDERLLPGWTWDNDWNPEPAIGWNAWEQARTDKATEYGAVAARALAAFNAGGPNARAEFVGRAAHPTPPAAEMQPAPTSVAAPQRSLVPEPTSGASDSVLVYEPPRRAKESARAWCARHWMLAGLPWPEKGPGRGQLRRRSVRRSRTIVLGTTARG